MGTCPMVLIKLRNIIKLMCTRMVYTLLVLTGFPVNTKGVNVNTIGYFSVTASWSCM